MKRKRFVSVPSGRPGSLEHVCPICRVYDPSWFIHHQQCPMYKGNLFRAPAAVAGLYRRFDVQITRAS